MCLSRFHLPAPLGSTVVTRFIATMGTLTPVLLLRAPAQVSLITERAFPDIPSPSTPCAPVFRPYFLLRAGLASDSLGFAIGGSSDFVHCSQSRRSHQAVSSLYRRRVARQLYGLSVHFQLLSTRHRWLAVTFRYWREAPPKRDFHPPMHARSQAHERGIHAASRRDRHHRPPELLRMFGTERALLKNLPQPRWGCSRLRDVHPR